MLAGKSNYQNRMTKMKNKEMSKEKLGQLVMQGLQGRGIKEGMGSHSRKDRGLEEKWIGNCLWAGVWSTFYHLWFVYQYSRGHVVGDSGIQLIFIELSVISSHMFKGQGAGRGIGGFWWEPISKRHSTGKGHATRIKQSNHGGLWWEPFSKSYSLLRVTPSH